MNARLRELESEAIFIIRETQAAFKNPVCLYSVGKDSSVLIHLIAKAFFPLRPPIPLLHIDTGFKFPEMLEFRDRRAAELGFQLTVHRNEEAIAASMNPHDHGIGACCGALKTQALLDALEQGGYDVALGGARRDEEASRAKERFFSHRDALGGWEPRSQRPEPWFHFNTRLKDGESMRAFPLSNWTEADIWDYIAEEGIELVPLYFADVRQVKRSGEQLIPLVNTEESGEALSIRYRTLGCYHCTAAIESTASTLDDIIAETATATLSERSSRLIDHGVSTMEDKKREGYF
ncbi:MAG: sulfate adenylyltransferase subunit CysD [Litorivicinus sp.]